MPRKLKNFKKCEYRYGYDCHHERLENCEHKAVLVTDFKQICVPEYYEQNYKRK